MRREDIRDESLEAPENLGAPADSSLSPRASRCLDREWRGLGRESGRMVLLSLLIGAMFVVAFVVLLAILG